MKKVIMIILICSMFVGAKDYSKHHETKLVMHTLVKQYGFDQHYLKRLFSDVEVQKSALRVFLPPKKRKVCRVDKKTKKKKCVIKKIVKKKKKKKSTGKNYGSWDRYAKRKVSPYRVQKGVEFIETYQTIFNQVEAKFGVPKEYVAAIIGIETAYGKNVGKYPVFDTLSTLAFEKNRRSKFFRSELIKFLHLSKTQKFNPKNVYGSYAGAIGLGQFMPSNYEAYGVDFNGDGRITLQRKADAIASVANYLKKHRWQKGEPVATRVRYEGNRFSRFKTGYNRKYNRVDLTGISPYIKWDYHDKVRLIKLEKKKYDELWYGANNFYVITRYNHSSYYAMAVHQLAMKIAEKLKAKKS